MFDIGISEIAVIGVVALVVLGPERLPKVARTAGHMFGRLQRYVATVKADINREMETSELSKIKDEVTSAARSFEQTMTEQTNALQTEARALEASTAIATPNIEAVPSQAALLQAQEDGLPSPETQPTTTSASTSAPAQPTPAANASNTAVQAQLQSFDLGIEPPRRRIS